MKKTLFIPFSSYWAACNFSDKNPEITFAHISGKITNPTTDNISITKGDDKHETKVNKEGKFYLNIELEKGAAFTFSHGEEITPVFLKRGDSLKMTLDTEQFDESITYEGAGSLRNNYLASNFLMKEKLQGNVRELYNFEEDVFMEKVDGKAEKLRAHLRDFFKDQQEGNEDFIQYANTSILYDWGMERMSYEPRHKYFAKKPDYQTSQAFNEFKNELEMDNGQLMENESYADFISSYFYEEVGKLYKEKKEEMSDPNSSTLLSFNKIDELFKSPKIIQALYTETMSDHIDFKGVNDLDTLLARYSSKVKEEKAQAKINKLIAEWQSLAKGKQAPSFTYNDIEGKKVALSDLKGKNVYIDVWATWCGPCKAEIPHLEKLQEDYSDMDVAFTSISIDSNKEAWEKMVKEKEMGGIQLFADKAWESDIVKDYMIQGIPRFILIDKNGKIINANAPRPSSEKIKENLKELTSKPVSSL